MKFTEEKLEKAFIELLENEHFEHHLGNTLIRSVDDVIIEEDLLDFLCSKYKNKQLNKNKLVQIIEMSI